MGLIFDILPYYVSGDFVASTPKKVSIAPKLPCPQLFPSCTQGSTPDDTSDHILRVLSF